MSKQYPDEATYDKLVRDRIPEIIESDGLVVETKELSKEELINALLNKIVEESSELQNSNDDERTKEMADVLEVLKSLAEEMDINWDEIEILMQKRAEKRGRFKKGVFLKRTYRK